MLRRANMKFIEKYIKLRSIVRKWGLKKIKTKNIPADWQKLISMTQ